MRLLCLFKRLLEHAFNLVTNNGTKIDILLTLILVRELFPTSDNKDYIPTTLISSIFLPEFVNFFYISCLLWHRFEIILLDKWNASFVYFLM